MVFSLLVSQVWAAGRKQQEERQTINNNWILCVTAFDSSSLPENQRLVADLFMRSLTDRIQTVNYRLRVSPEYAYYESYAWSKDVAAAAKALEAKQNERTLLLFQGEPGWKYRQNIKKKDAEIIKALEDYEKKESEKPLVNITPDFDITQGNKEKNFPAPPQAGNEYNFCQTNNVDGFLSGSITEFYGRYYVKLMLYVQYIRSGIYEGDIIFSADSIDEAVADVSAKLTMILAGNKPAAISVKADPPDTLVLINQNFAGKGSVPALEIPPGKVTIALSSDDYNSEFIETELNPAELAEIEVTLSPYAKGDVDINVPGKTGTAVYQGALYVGEAPLSLKLPLNQLEYINILGVNKEETKVVFFTPEDVNKGLLLSLKLKKTLPGERRVNKARNLYYWAWGGTWVTGITAWITYGISTGYTEAFQNSGNPALIPNANRMYYINLGAVAITGTAIVYEVFRMYKYLNTATAKTTPIVKSEIKK
jgi:hypothetical protein